MITGGPGAGKTTLLNALQERGYPHVPEVAREIIRQQLATGGDALPWANREAYTQLMLERSVRTYQDAVQTNEKNSPVLFFDRGIPDTVAWSRLIELPIAPELDEAAHTLRYHSIVFILPPWQEIYQTDQERKQTWEEAIATYDALYKAYADYGYELSIVPPAPVEERIAFVLGKLHETL